MTIAITQVIFALIMGLSILSLGCFLERLYYLRRSHVHYPTFITGIQNLIDKGRFIEALTLCQEHAASVVQLIKVGLAHAHERESVRETLMRQTALLEKMRLMQRLGVLRFVAQAAPTMGLIGTLLSLYVFLKELKGMGAYWDNAFLMDALLQSSLLTLVGLLVGFIAHTGHVILKARIDLRLHDMNAAYTDLIALIQSPAVQACMVPIDSGD